MGKQKTHRHALGGWIILTIVIGSTFQPYSNDISLATAIAMAILTLVFIILVVWLVNRRTHSGYLFTSKLCFDWLQKLLIALIIINFCYLYIANDNIHSVIELIHSPFKVALICSTVAVSAGFLEEYTSRGYFFNLTQRILQKLGWQNHTLLISSIISSLLFGLLHLGNVVESPLDAVLQQTFYATCLGFVFAAVRIITNQIYPSAILHTLFDLQITITDATTAGSWWEVLASFLPGAIISLILIYSIDRQVQKTPELLIRQ